MNRPTLTVLMVALFSLAMNASGAVTVQPPDTTHDFTRYQIILDRAPFGAIGGAPPVEQPGFATRFTFIGMVQMDSDAPPLAVIMENDNKHINFKAEGETIGTVKIDKIEKSDKGPTKLVLKQGLETATLVLESKAAGGAPAAGAPANPGQPGQPPVQGTVQPGARRIPFRRGG